MEEHLNFRRNSSVYFALKIFTPLRLSQQYEAQEFLPDKVFYVPGGWRYRFIFRVEATIFALQENWLSVEIRICLASVSVKPREARTCTAYLYINLPNDRHMAPPPPRHCCEYHGVLPRTPGLL